MSSDLTDHNTEANLAAALECVLYLAGEPLSTAELARILEVTPRRAEEIAAQLAASLEGRGLQVVNVAGGYRLCTRPEYSPYVERIHPPQRIRLSRAALETLAIVAYRQPVTRPEVEAIRGVNVDGVVETLLNYGLVSEKGRKQAPGRPTLYCTTEEFLTRFGLNRLNDLPPLPEGEQASAVLLQAQAAAAD
jgi:segregation and condensation protein B